MRNLNEPRRDDLAESQPEGRVISMESRRTSNQMEDLRSRWTVIQASFVDEPRKAVQEADALLSAAIKQTEESFHSQKSQIETLLNRGSEASTEDLRIALQRYRVLLDRLLSI